MINNMEVVRVKIAEQAQNGPNKIPNCFFSNNRQKLQAMQSKHTQRRRV